MRSKSNPSRRSTCRSRRGVTLLDMVVTMLVMGILVAVATPKYTDAIQRFQLRAAANRVAADLEYARQNAKTKGTSQSVTFTASTSAYTLTGMNDVNHPTQPFTVKLDQADQSATIDSVRFGASGSGSTITFDMHGRPDYAGDLTINLGSSRYKIAVDPTGKVLTSELPPAKKG